MVGLNELLEFLRTRGASLEQQLDLLCGFNRALPVIAGLDAAQLRNASAKPCGQGIRSEFLGNGRIGRRRQKQGHISAHTHSSETRFRCRYRITGLSEPQAARLAVAGSRGEASRLVLAEQYNTIAPRPENLKKKARQIAWLSFDA
jgi:hypothetical protein